MTGDRVKNAETADQLREARGETGQAPPIGADLGTDEEPGVGVGGPLSARGNLDARRPLGDDEIGSGGRETASGSEDPGAPYPAVGLDTDEAQDEPG